MAAVGVIVVVAAGNNGKDAITGQEIYGHIHSPGNDPSVLTVGASNTFGTDSRSDDIVTTYSSHGPTRSFYTDLSGRHYDNVIKPDIVAPGNRIVGAKARSTSYLITSNPSLMEAAMNLTGDDKAQPAGIRERIGVLALGCCPLTHERGQLCGCFVDLSRGLRFHNNFGRAGDLRLNDGLRFFSDHAGFKTIVAERRRVVRRTIAVTIHPQPGSLRVPPVPRLWGPGRPRVSRSLS